jgi:succinyl-CoA synthetase beta subunit
MNIHEYQAKRLLAEYEIPVPAGFPASNPEEACRRAEELGGSSWMIKAQIHAGGRGKAGGVRRAASINEVASNASSLLGSRLVTHQTGPGGQTVHSVLIEVPTRIARELYLGLLIDRARQRVAVIASASGGMDIESVAAQTPDKVLTRQIHPVLGPMAYQAQELGFALGLDKNQRQQFAKLLASLYTVFQEKDLSMLEINPLVITSEGDLLALDAKINLDDNGLYRHPDMAALYDASQMDEREHAAREHELNYITLDGDIACMVNGAGLAMATMDLIKLHGGEPANFLDVGGGATADRVAEAFKLISSDHKVKAILVNIFGGIVRCDLIAEGIIKATRKLGLTLPVVARLEGTNVEKGRELLNQSGLAITAATDLTDAAQKVVAAARIQGVAA